MSIENPTVKGIIPSAKGVPWNASAGVQPFPMAHQAARFEGVSLRARLAAEIAAI
jgi:hypothetical protein